MINNLELIKPLLNFEKEGDFYMLYIFKRKKDQVEAEKENSQSVRTIKTYCVENIEYLEKRWDEITHLCEYFKARAYIHVQKQNHKDVGFNMLAELANKIRDGVYKFNNLFDSVVGKLKTYEKRWVVDIDTKDEQYLLNTIVCIESTEPFEYFYTNVDFQGISYPSKEAKLKIIEQIPTKNGWHLITKPFNIEQFNKYLKEKESVLPDIQKRNPCMLYFPDSLDYLNKIPHLKQIDDKSFNYWYGKKHKEESKVKMSNAKLGRKHSKETIEKISKSQLGKKHTEEAKEKMSKSRKERIFVDKNKDNL